MTDFYTNEYSFRHMEYPEIKDLEVGDKIAICVEWNPPKFAKFIDVTVVSQLIAKSDTIETTNGFIDINNIYEVTNNF